MQSDVLFSVQVKFSLKGMCHEIFCFRFFSWIVFLHSPENNIRIISQIKVHHWYQRHRWQIIGTVSDFLHLKGNIKEKKYLYVISTIERCPNKIIKTFLIEDFFHLPPVSMTIVVQLELRKSPWIFARIWNGPNGILKGLGETDSWKKPEVQNLVALSL